MINHLFDALLGPSTPAERRFMTSPSGRSLTYGDLRDASARYAHALVALGVTPGDRVAVQVDKSPEALILYLACVRAGAVYLPLNTAYTLAELDYFITDASPALIVCDPSRREAMQALARQRGVAQVRDLNAEGHGTLVLAAADQSPQFDNIARGG